MGEVTGGDADRGDKGFVVGRNACRGLTTASDRGLEGRAAIELSRKSDFATCTGALSWAMSEMFACLT